MVAASSNRLGAGAGADQHVVALVDAVENVGDALAHAFRGDAVCGVVGGLLFAAARRLRHGALHRAGDRVGVQDDAAVDVARGAADGLHQRGLAAQKAFLVGIEDGDQCAFRNIEALAQQVDADQRVERAKAEVANDFDAFDGVDVGMHVAHPNALLVQIFGQILGHALGQHGDQRAIALLRHRAHLADQVVDLHARRPHVDRRIDQAGRADHLLGEHAAGFVELPRPRRRRHGGGLRPHRVPFLEAQRPVVHARRQAEAVFGERRLAPKIAAIHAAELRHGDVALVDEDQRIVGHIFEQGRRRLAGFSPGEIARIVLDAGAGAGRLHHFQIVQRALLEPLRFEQAARGMELVQPLAQFELYAGQRLQQRRPRRHIVRIGVDLDEFQLVGFLPGERIEFVDRFHLVAEQRHPPGAILIVRRENLDGVATHAERAAMEIGGGALVLQRHQVGEQLALVELRAALDRERHRRIGLDRTDAVDARHRGHDDDVVALEQRPRRRVPHAVDLLVDRGILLDIGVGARDIGFRLVVVVIRHEIFDGVVGKERPELAVELRRQRLVRRQDQRRALRRFDHLGDGEGFAGAGDAEQHLGAVVAPHAFDQVGDRRRLVALGIEIRLDDETPAAFGFVRPRRPVRRPDFVVAVLLRGIPRGLRAANVRAPASRR